MSDQKKAKFFVMPDSRVLLFSFTILAAILSWILPAGEYNVDPATKRVIAGTFHYVANNPQGFWAVMSAPLQGFVKQASLISTICVIGASIFMLNESGAVEKAFKIYTSRQKGELNVYRIVFVVMFILTFTGATSILGNATVALAPLGILLGRNIGLDKAAGGLMIYWGVFSGFDVGWANFSTIGTAQTIAEIPLYSGLYVRLFFHLVNFTLVYTFLCRYIRDVKKDPTKSLCYGEESADKANTSFVDDNTPMSFSQKASLLCMLLTLIFVIFGAVKFRWNNTHFSVVFFINAIVIGFLCGHGPSTISKMFMKGYSNLIPAASMVAFANGISIVLANGKILSTIIHAMSIPISTAGPVLGVVLMFLANYVVNFFIGSGSGQAAAVMPIMVPLADLNGITRQVAVQCFQFGDGLCNSYTPCGPTLNAILGMCDTSFGKYFKRFWPLALCQICFACCAVVVLQSIGWTGL